MSLDDLFAEKDQLYKDLKEQGRQEFSRNGDVRRLKWKVSQKENLLENTRNPRLKQQLEAELVNERYALNEAEEGIQEVSDRIKEIKKDIEDVKEAISDGKSERSSRSNYRESRGNGGRSGSGGWSHGSSEPYGSGR